MQPTIFITPSGRATPHQRVAGIIATMEQMRVSLHRPLPLLADKRGR